MTTPAAFELHDVAVTTPGQHILDAVDVSVPADGVTALIGPSGSGKTRLLRLLNRLDLPATGTISYRGTPLDQLDTRELRRQVGMVFQRPPLFPGTVLDNLRVAKTDLDRDQATASLERVRLKPDQLEQDARSLSGGEAQRMCFARALLTGPDVLLADEPTAGLDEVPKLTLETLTRELADDRVAVVWVSHDREQVDRLADHILVVRDGTVTAG